MRKSRVRWIKEQIQMPMFKGRRQAPTSQMVRRAKRAYKAKRAGRPFATNQRELR